MKIWHPNVIEHLSKQQLLSLHTSCCAVRKNWHISGGEFKCPSKTHIYHIRHSYALLFTYHADVLYEMEERGYKPNKLWWFTQYRGGKISNLDPSVNTCLYLHESSYPEHNEEWLKSDLKDLEDLRNDLNIKEAKQ